MLLHSPKTTHKPHQKSSNHTQNYHKPTLTHLKFTTPNSHSYSHSHSLENYVTTNPNNNANRLKCTAAFSSIGMLAAAVVLSTPAPTDETLSNIPQTLSGKSCVPDVDVFECEDTKVKRIQKPKSRNAESCTSKCVTTCTRGGGGDGSPGEGPLNFRGPIVVFKQGFRSRQYCLVECSDICNLIDDASKGR